jgi:hypothetical protein
MPSGRLGDRVNDRRGWDDERDGPGCGALGSVGGRLWLPTREHHLRNMTAGQLIDLTASGGGVRIAETDGTRSEATIFDTFGDMASVRIDAIT